MIRGARAALLALALPVAAGAAGPVPVDFVDASRPTRCAEEDNVYVRIEGPDVSSFRIVAEHPPYVASIVEDSTAPDFTDCDMSGDPVFRFEPRTVVLHEDATLRVVGHRFETFWRPENVDVVVDGRREPGLHLVQLIRRGPPRDVEMLVVYPSDGYWRPKPLPPAHLPDTAYGSSFLVGPIDEDGRPYVALSRIELDTASLRFALSFADGSRGTLAIERATPERIVLAVALDPPRPAGRPFAALRSMFVRTEQADVSVARWRGADGAPRVAPILGFGRVRAPSARFGRDLPSRHNLSAPDVVFEGFETRGGAAAPGR
ncbi:MAG TPA: hypothetical protein VEA81_06810 [Burkholderiaceae bacterium]|nr:hypothetical protein [Burkholderiaceae bacterium]